MEDLRFLGFDWDEPPLYQSERTAIYEQALRQLDAQGALYPCFCSRAALHASAAPPAGAGRARRGPLAGAGRAAGPLPGRLGPARLQGAAQAARRPQ